MRIFLERFVLSSLSPLLVLFAVTNPLGLSWPLRIVCIIGIVIATAIAAYFAGWAEWRWERLRGLWWFWVIFGPSGGVAVTLWLAPLIVGAPASETDASKVALQSQVNEARQQRDQAKQDIGVLQSQLASKTAELANVRQQLTALQSQLSSEQAELSQVEHHIRDTIGPVTAINLANILRAADTIPKTLILLTSASDHEWLRQPIDNNTRQESSR